MAKEIDFATGTIVTADFLDALQEIESAIALGVRLERQSATVIRVPTASDGSVGGLATLRINGKPRFISTALTHNFTGAGAGLYHVFAMAGAGPGFTLSVQLSATPPADSRKIGEVDWSGSAITDVRNMIDAVPGHNALHRPGGADPIYGASPGYTPAPSNVVVDRSFDANNVTLHELADVVGTLINDLKAAGILTS